MYDGILDILEWSFYYYSDLIIVWNFNNFLVQRDECNICALLFFFRLALFVCDLSNQTATTI